jgi:hypothetical protein
MLLGWRRSFWKSFWFAILRVKVDKRARTAVVRAAVLLTWILVELWLVFLVPSHEGHGVFQMIFNGFIVVTGLIAARLTSRSNRKQNELLNFSITGQIPRQPPEPDSQRVRHYLETRAAIIASLLARGAGEIYLVTHEVPIGAEIMTRQIQNSALRRLGLWEELDPAEKELVFCTDGTWTEDQRKTVISWCEQLRLLRWTLRMDSELVPLAHQPDIDFSIAQMSLGEGSKPMRSTWDLREEREIALAYLARVVAELNARSLLDDSSELNWARAFRENLLGGSTDYLARSQTVADLDEGALRTLGSVANERAKYAGYLVDQLSSPEPLRFLDWWHSNAPK